MSSTTLPHNHSSDVLELEFLLVKQENAEIQAEVERLRRELATMTKLLAQAAEERRLAVEAAEAARAEAARAEAARAEAAAPPPQSAEARLWLIVRDTILRPGAGTLDRDTLRAAAVALRESGLIDPDFYLVTYPDVARVRFDPAEHYLRFGHREGRRPLPPAMS